MTTTDRLAEALAAWRPTMTDPFLCWLPMYAPGTVPERPWWRTDGHPLAFIRCDGLRANGDRGSMAEADTTHPLAAPSPMVGQVWAGESGEAEITGMAGMQVWWLGPRIAGPDGLAAWPPPGAVLVAGPTPWGRDVPWAPAGWRAR